ncbi:polysaccharide biosynthesis tyrosine autokinase [Actinoallomurus oryzae]|uniref:non-specific protein-tyrosine kinase n=1 Tax=Actinoallomurus oryzae TaxID=502180 RepID=A0ABP8R7K9_9ACTN
MELLHYLRLLRRRWKLVAASILLALIAAAFATTRMSPRYAATITMIVSAPANGGNAAVAYQGSLLSQDRAKSYAKLIQSRTVATAVATALGDGMTAEELRPKISAVAVPDTVLVRATVTDASPELAMRIARTLGTTFAGYVDRLERPDRTAPAGVRVTVADDADPPRVPVSPRPLVNLGIGLVIGAAVGVVGAVLRDRTDTSIRSAGALHEVAGGTVLGTVPADGRMDLGVRGDAPLAESFRRIRANLRFAQGGDFLPRSVVVTSALPGEGKTTVACNLAVSLAEAGWKVILVDADLRGSSLASRLGVEEADGLAELLSGGRTVDEVLCQWGPDTLSVLPGGAARGNPGDLVASRMMSSILHELGDRADIVLIDTPPLLSTTDAAVLARGCAGALVVARHGRTRREDVAQAAERLETVHARVLGTVLNGDQPARGAYPGGDLRLFRPAIRRRLAAQR